MIGKKVIEERIVTNSEAKDILKDRESEGEIGFEQQSTKEYLDKFSKLDAKKALKLIEELKKIGRVNDEIAVMIANLLPKYPEQIQQIAAKSKVTLSAGEAEEILKLVKEAEK